LPRSLESSGKSIEEAVEAGLRELGISRDQVEVEVLEEPAKGLFGLLGSRPARVRLTVREGVADRARDLVERIARAMGVEPEVKVREEDEHLSVELEGKNLGVLIGRRGETLNALQYIVSLAVNKERGEERKKVFLDVEGYRKKREETLQRLAVRLADKAKRRGRSVVLEPMSPQERRIIHTTLRGRDDIYTFSEGEEPFRKIIIAPRR